MCTLDIQDFNIVQSCHIISVMFHWIITCSPTLESDMESMHLSWFWNKTKNVEIIRKQNPKNNQRNFKPLDFPTDSANVREKLKI